MNYAQEQLKSEGKLVFQRSKGQDVINTVLLLALCAMFVIGLVANARYEASYQQNMNQICADFQAKYHQPGFGCNSSNVGTSANDIWLYAIAIIGFISTVVILARIIPRLFRPGVYTFDVHSNSFSLDGKELSRISDIKEVRVKHYRNYSLDIVYKSGKPERLGAYWLSSSANDEANKIAHFIHKPKTDS